jgi:hypothetical protein
VLFDLVCIKIRAAKQFDNLPVDTRTLLPPTRILIPNHLNGTNNNQTLTVTLFYSYIIPASNVILLTESQITSIFSDRYCFVSCSTSL